MTPKPQKLFNDKELQLLYMKDNSVSMCLDNACFILGQREGRASMLQDVLKLLDELTSSHGWLETEQLKAMLTNNPPTLSKSVDGNNTPEKASIQNSESQTYGNQRMLQTQKGLECLECGPSEKSPAQSEQESGIQEIDITPDEKPAIRKGCGKKVMDSRYPKIEAFRCGEEDLVNGKVQICLCPSCQPKDGEKSL